MPQKLDAEAVTLVCPFDDARNIGHDEGAKVAQLNHTEVRFECGERVIRNLRSGCGDHRDQRAFAGIGEADQSDVGEEFEFQAKLEFLPFLAGFVFSGSLMRSSREARVALSAAAATSHGEHLTGCGEIEELLAGLIVVDPLYLREPGARSGCRSFRGSWSLLRDARARRYARD